MGDQIPRAPGCSQVGLDFWRHTVKLPSPSRPEPPRVGWFARDRAPTSADPDDVTFLKELFIELQGQYAHDDQYRAFVGTYGYDIADWPGFPVLRAIRELTMTTWLMQLVDQADAGHRSHQRVDDIRRRLSPRRWKTF